MRVRVVIAVAGLLASMLATYAVAADPADGLASVESFAAIQDPAARSAAIFTELGKVLTHPRCVNCHPAGDRPRQRDVMRLHQPPVERGADGFGLPAMRCPICHQAANFEPAGVPGNPIGFQDRDRPATARDLARGRQSGKAGTDHADVDVEIEGQASRLRLSLRPCRDIMSVRFACGRLAHCFYLDVGLCACHLVRRSKSIH